MEPLSHLVSSVSGAADHLAALRGWNAAGRLPTRNGFSRPLPLPRQILLEHEAVQRLAGSQPHAGGTLQALGTGTTTWAGRIEVADAYRLRLHLSSVDLPAGTRLWVVGGGGDSVGPFGAELVGPEGDLWTPSVAGPSVTLEAAIEDDQLEERPLRFEIDKVIEIVPLGADSSTGASHIDTSCFVDARCVTSSTLDVVEPYRHAVAHLEFVIGGSSSAICTGALLNNTQGSGVPYLLTANHCFSNQASASTLEAYWDAYSNSCGGPSATSFPSSFGATLLATSTSSDFTFVRLNSVPSGRIFLGWNANASAVGPGTILHRISHPAVPHQNAFFLQAYSQTRVATGLPTCNGEPAFNIDSEKLLGDVSGGSSGAPVILAGGFVVGQLTGGCPGFGGSEICTLMNHVVDGAFSATFPHIEQFLAPNQLPSGPCVDDEHTLCLHDNRFRVQVSFRPTGGATQLANRINFTDRAGLFWFFNPANVEMLIKVQNACIDPFNHYWVFFAATTNVEFKVIVTDTEKGLTKEYGNSAGTAALPIQDTQAFATCP